MSSLVNLLNRWATATAATAWHATAWHTAFRHTATACCLVDLHHDWIDDALQLLLPCLDFILFGQLILVKPIQRLLHCRLNLLLVPTLELVLELVIGKSVAHLEAVILEAVLRFNFLLVLLIFCPVLLCFLHHAVNLRLRKPTLFICNGDLIRLATGLVLGRYVQDAIGVDIESDLDLRNTTWGWRNSIQVELTQEVVIFRHRALALEDLDEHSRLVVSVRGEGLALLCWDGCVPLNELRHHASRSFETH